MINRKSVLVVDNDQNFRRILEAKLLNYGFEVDSASNATDALKLLIHKTFHIVLLDLHLPDTDGIAALSRLKAAAPWTPFIAMSTHETPNLEGRVWEAGGLKTLYKPFDLDTLASLIRSSISGAGVRHFAPPMFSFQTIVPDQNLLAGRFKTTPEEMVPAKVLSTTPESFQITFENAFPVKGKSIDIRILGEDGLYEFTSTVLHVDKDGLTYTVRKPSLIKRRQRRRYPRTAISYPVKVEISEEQIPRKEVSGIGRDISLGGVALNSMTPVPKGSRVDVLWGNEWSSKEKPLTISGRVVRVTDISHTEKLPVYQIAIEFDKLNPNANKLLGRFITSIQLMKPNYLGSVEFET